MKQVLIDTKSKTYKVFIDARLRFTIGTLLESIVTQPVSSVFVVTDSVVAPLYLDDVVGSFEQKLPIHTEVIPSGEASKSFSVYENVMTKALECGLDRKSVIVALGGGVVGDLAGFVAATYMRGIRFVQVPTTLLAHDSSVGGKVAINHPLGKNMVGSFHQPEAVFYDTETLYSLPEKEWRSGFAEVIKHGFIRDQRLLSWLQKEVSSFNDIPVQIVNDLLEQSLAVKANIVAEDETESSVRAYLNFGHTLAHAIESELGYGEVTHGEAVAIGMIYALKLSEKTFKVDLEVEKYEQWFQLLGYKTQIPSHLQPVQLLKKMQSDKKAEAGTIRMVLLRELEEAILLEIPPNSIKELLDEQLEVE
ncbi:3-dehydroquinate synthase [Halalkalibacter wakoensis JCM 9140]|uniref:3-dehydroquinate synthase n=1 Tax=Halalkalibacter wakoensis JCM 9140 TaxID=1236970 RepID=W4Q127_9BACI|nr:3-dehydroquinate synthase [Halalkalibacter wakoensis]GAE25079.1 3-dehydroquinate synthase [Halalkalibacter wakoensis JCM 9140]